MQRLTTTSDWNLVFYADDTDKYKFINIAKNKKCFTDVKVGTVPPFPSDLLVSHFMKGHNYLANSYLTMLLRSRLIKW